MVPALAIDGLGLRIGGVTIVDGVSFAVRPGEFVIVIGPNGAGKTTLLNLLSGVAHPTAGRVLLGERDVTRMPPYRRARLGLGRTFQTSTIFAGLTTLENARIAADAALGTSARVWPLADGAAAPLARARAALADVGLTGREATIASALSHGEKRKLDLAILLCTQANVVLLDEPTAGMAADDVDEMVALISRIGREHAKTIVMVEHRLDLVLGLADRVAVMHHGALLAIGPPAEIVANETVQSAYLGDPL